MKVFVVTDEARKILISPYFKMLARSPSDSCSIFWMYVRSIESEMSLKKIVF